MPSNICPQCLHWKKSKRRDYSKPSDISHLGGQVLEVLAKVWLGGQRNKSDPLDHDPHASHSAHFQHFWKTNKLHKHNILRTKRIETLFSSQTKSKTTKVQKFFELSHHPINRLSYPQTITMNRKYWKTYNKIRSCYISMPSKVR